MLIRMPVAPSIETSSSSGELIAFSAASIARRLPVADAGAHERAAHVRHDRAHVGEVDVDEAGDGDQVADALHGVEQDLVGLAERVDHRRLLPDEREQPLVRDGDQRVDRGGEALDALDRLARALLAFEAERLGDDADGERAAVARDLRDDRRRAGAGAAAHAGGDEHHVGARR